MSPHVANTSFANLPYSVNLPHLPCLLSTPFSNLPHLPCLSSTSFSLPPCDRVLAGKLSVFLLRKCFCSLAFLTNHLFPLYQFLFECSTPELLFLPCFLREESFSSIQNVIVITQTSSFCALVKVGLHCTAWYWFHCAHLHPPLPNTIHPPQSYFSQCVCYISTVLYVFHIYLLSPGGTWQVYFFIISHVPHFIFYPILSSALFSDLPFYLPHLQIYSKFFFRLIYPIISSTPFIIYLIFQSSFSDLPHLVMYSKFSPTSKRNLPYFAPEGRQQFLLGQLARRQRTFSI